MFFDEYLKKLNTSRREMIYTKLSEFSNHCPVVYQMIQNLYIESQLKMADWKELVFLLEQPGINRTTFKDVIKAFCRNNRSLVGKKANVKGTMVFGRAVSFENLYKMLRKYLNEKKSKNNFATRKEAKAYLRRLIGQSPAITPPKWKEFEIGRFLIWSTFKPKAGKPFGDPLPVAKNIICSLGLPPQKSPIIVLEYHLPRGLKLRIPTICDAYSADQWLPYFRPALPGADYGKTMPTDTCPDKGRPEIVHDVIKAENLVAPLEFAP